MRYVCMCVLCCRRHRRPKGIGWSKEKKGEKTETDMQSKAIEGVPRRAHARSCAARSWYFSLYLASRVLVESSFFSLSRSAHVDLIYADYFTIAIDHPHGWKKKEKESKKKKSTSCTHKRPTRSGNKDNQRMSRRRKQFFLHLCHYVRWSIYLFFSSAINKCFLIRTKKKYFFIAIGHFNLDN